MVNMQRLVSIWLHYRTKGLIGLFVVFENKLTAVYYQKLEDYKLKCCHIVVDGKTNKITLKTLFWPLD